MGTIEPGDVRIRERTVEQIGEAEWRVLDRSTARESGGLEGSERGALLGAIGSERERRDETRRERERECVCVCVVASREHANDKGDSGPQLPAVQRGRAIVFIRFSSQ